MNKLCIIYTSLLLLNYFRRAIKYDSAEDHNEHIIAGAWEKENIEKEGKT